MFYIILLIICVFFPEITLSTAKESIALWYSSVLPSLFPFFIIIKLIYYNDGMIVFSKIFKPITSILNLPDYAAFPFVMSILCGYPSGSRSVAQIKEIKDKNYLANICYSSSPLFIIGTIGTMLLNDINKGYALYIIHICTVFIFATIYSTEEENKKIVLFSEKGSLYDAITNSVSSILNICGFMVLFNIITKIIAFSFIPDKINAVISGLIEFTNGIRNVNALYNDPLPLISFLLSFGGFCVIFQCLSLFKKINKVKFILNRLICGIISFVLCHIYKKTAIYVPIAITLIIVIFAYILRRKNCYLLKSSKSCEI